MRSFSVTLIDAVILASTIGVVLAVLQVLPEIVSNRHLQHGAYRIVILLLGERIAVSCAILGTAAATAAVLGWVLRLGTDRRSAFVLTVIGVAALGLVAGANVGDVQRTLQHSALAQVLKDNLPDESYRRLLLRNQRWILGAAFLVVALPVLLVATHLLARSKWPGRALDLRRRRATLLTSLVVVAALVVAGRLLAHGALDVGRPNVVLITLDTLRADHLGGYGYPRPTSPHLDALARRALVYVDSRSVSPWTAPAHASLFTGRYPSEHGLHSFLPASPEEGNVYSLSPANECLAEILRDHLYETCAIISNFLYLTPKFRLDQGFEIWDVLVGKGRRVRYRDAAEMSEIVLPWLRARGPRPFFLFLNYMDAHTPYLPPVPFDRRFDGAMPVDTGELMRRAYDPVLSGKRPLGADERAHLVSQYDGEIRFLDAEIGRLLDELEMLGLDDNTLLVVTSDHGEYFGEHALLEHSREVYEPVLRVPLLVRGPGGTEAGIEREPFPGNGVFDLVLRACGLGDKVPDAEAINVAEAFFARPKDLRADWGHRFQRVRRALYHGDHKLVWSSDGQHELYELTQDPGETRNLAAEEPELLRELVLRMESWIEEASVQEERRTRSEVQPDEADREAMRALGYL